MNTDFGRKSGILAHITSLPGEWGMGELGPSARRFCELLHASGQKLWQILPTSPVGFGFSPYSSPSAFAGNHLLISFDELIEEGLLSRRNLSRFPKFDQKKIDFFKVIEAREKVLFKVADKFESTEQFEEFCEAEAEWLDDYSLFMALRDAFDGKTWDKWPEELRDRDFQSLKDANKKYEKRIRRHKVLQFLFYKQWKKIEDFSHELGISIIGDIPIFVSGDSADVWANRELFFLDTDGKATVVAGVPPDYFSETGQRWGNPLYDWAAHRAGAYKWWTARMRHCFSMYDIVRIDHFRAFEAYWEIPVDEPTAINGRWVKGPNLEFFHTLEENLRKLPEFEESFELSDHVIAEDLGEITDAVRELCEKCGFPGMDVLQFRFSENDMNKEGYRPEGNRENRVVYTGTHDNDTTKSWFGNVDELQRHIVRTYLSCDGSNISNDFCALAMRSPAKWAVLPLQDVIGEGVRMNAPGTVGGENWKWRFTDEMLSLEIQQKLREMTEQNGR